MGLLRAATRNAVKLIGRRLLELIATLLRRNPVVDELIMLWVRGRVGSGQ